MTDPNSYKARLEAKLQPARVRATRAFAGLFQLTHEMLKSMVLDDVQNFYGYIGVGDGTAPRKRRARVPPQSPGPGPGQAVPCVASMAAEHGRHYPQAGRP
ncbi:MAG: hypothetical protein K0R13_3590, partial [Propionibacteriaceae bacterium]|nr:hypothetical protein [Propionibacteriaceae bacterium]